MVSCKKMPDLRNWPQVQNHEPIRHPMPKKLETFWKLEAVQRRAVRMMSDVKSYTYEEKLRDAGLELLKERGDMLEAFKAVNGYEKVRKEELFTFQEGKRRTRQIT